MYEKDDKKNIAVGSFANFGQKSTEILKVEREKNVCKKFYFLYLNIKKKKRNKNFYFSFM